MKKVIRFVFLSIVFLLLLSIDSIFGIHALFIGAVLVLLAYFYGFSSLAWYLVFLGLFHDVAYGYPLGFSVIVFSFLFIVWSYLHQIGIWQFVRLFVINCFVSLIFYLVDHSFAVSQIVVMICISFVWAFISQVTVAREIRWMVSK